MASSAHRVLHVEDDEVNRELLAHVVALAPGWTVTGVGSLSEATALLDSGAEFDLVIIDLDLPDGSGEALLPVVGPDGRATPVWAVTGDASADTRTRLGAAGVGHVLVKPFGIADVVTALQALG
jgi:two-component system OmpR family response regulator